jgi:DNA-directed RNA polymerase subunit RPC12/RpoP
MVEEDIKNQVVKCEFCGFTFQKCAGISCDSWPINCKTVKCPNCGYEILPESKSYKFMEDSVKKIKDKFFK